LAIEQLLEGEGEKLARKAVERALAGDVLALRLCLERICPPRRERHIRIELPETTDARSISGAFAALLRAVAAGEVEPGQAARLAQMLEAHRRVIETEMLEQRIAELEEKMPSGKASTFPTR